jgi:hypothetical protein
VVSSRAVRPLDYGDRVISAQQERPTVLPLAVVDVVVGFTDDLTVIAVHP